ncbi:MAG: ParA family protein [Rhodococcus sp. (in: high G+C Gram-positive bacteria)]
MSTSQHPARTDAYGPDAARASSASSGASTENVAPVEGRATEDVTKDPAPHDAALKTPPKTAANGTAKDASKDAEKEAEKDAAKDEVKLGPTGRPIREIPEPPELHTHGPATVLAMCNQKGGVGKTTSTINLGAALAEYGRRVLLVDFDPQGALSVGLGVQPHELDQSVYNVIMERSLPVDSVIRNTKLEGVDLLPSNIDLSAAEVQLVAEVGREHTLLRVLTPVMKQYDYVLVDCQPSLGLLTVNALTASDGVIIPLECEFFSLRGVALLIDTIDKVRERLNPKLDITGILATMFDPRTLHSKEVMARVVEAFGDTVFDTVINRTVRFPETTVAGEPITRWAPRSVGANSYRQLAREVIAR